jgi:hypothetical protein
VRVYVAVREVVEVVVILLVAEWSFFILEKFIVFYDKKFKEK